jgi:hypothetical protein
MKTKMKTKAPKKAVKSVKNIATKKAVKKTIMKTATISLRVPIDFKANLQEICNTQNVSMTELCLSRLTPVSQIAPIDAVKAIEKKVNSKKQTGFLKITVNHSKFKIQDIKFSVNKLSLEMIIEIWEQLGGFLERQIEEIAEEEGLKKKTTKKKTNTKKK